MLERLILGSGSLVPLVARNVDGPVRVGTPDNHLASTLRDEEIEAGHLDPTDPAALAGRDTDVVFVLEDTEQAALAAASAAREALPGAYLLAYAGDTRGASGSLASVADRVLTPEGTVTAQILSCVTDSRLASLTRTLRSIERLAVVTHDNPDPDAIASGVALMRLATAVGCEAVVCYYGDISHQENRAFVNLLELELRRLDPDEGLSAFDGVALVDHAEPGVNDQLPADTAVDIVIDHHPPRGQVEGRFVDVRVDVGATSTLLVEYLVGYGRQIDTDVATALLFGIHVDTDAFRRGVSPRDFEAAATLVDAADLPLLDSIESPSIDRGTYDVLAQAIDSRVVEGEVLFSFVGRITNRDVLPQAADRLLQLEGVTTTVVYGIMDGTVYISARSRADDMDLGGAMRDAFDPVGSAGGHLDMAGAQLPLGVFGELQDTDSLGPLVESSVMNRVLAVLDEAARGPVTHAPDGCEHSPEPLPDDSEP